MEVFMHSNAHVEELVNQVSELTGRQFMYMLFLLNGEVDLDSSEFIADAEYWSTPESVEFADDLGRVVGSYKLRGIE
ncbi:MAG: hypothetical protein DSY80_06965 [Desulfocapsa sp.]|nr:MAG: hypothetical protein DSY80_06965 [Desulfocapsa sp.]